ncbi:MAG: hypothetical protein RL223_2079 [Pseudomonadota bacterium]
MGRTPEPVTGARSGQAASESPACPCARATIVWPLAFPDRLPHRSGSPQAVDPPCGNVRRRLAVRRARRRVGRTSWATDGARVERGGAGDASCVPKSPPPAPPRSAPTRPGIHAPAPVPRHRPACRAAASGQGRGGPHDDFGTHEEGGPPRTCPPAPITAHPDHPPHPNPHPHPPPTPRHYLAQSAASASDPGSTLSRRKHAHPL